MENCNLAVIIHNPANHDEILFVRQSPPAKFGEEEYDSYMDSELWDLPSAQLEVVQEESKQVVDGQKFRFQSCDLRRFDVESAFDRALGKLGFGLDDFGERTFKRWEEPEFGPDSPHHTLFITVKLLVLAPQHNIQELFKWMSVQECLKYLQEVKPGNERVGPLTVLGVLNDSPQSLKLKISPSLPCQEYPPGIMLVPMRSRTAKPFNTTNLIICAPENDFGGSINCSESVVQGDALIVDPGCHHELHEELRKIVAALPRKLIVFVTHHHHDHIDGLSVVQECNPEAILLAHDKTRHRIGKDGWSAGYTPISGGEDIYVGGQRLTAIFAPGHTDGHAALLHVSTQSLIVGDHCVGQGSAILDASSGGNMADYFESTYKFLELSPHVLIPMHGRVNLWPKHMLCGYLKNRRSREASILRAVEGGAKTLFDVVANVYSSVDRSFWFPAASNVRLHMDHLAQQNKLPEGFSIEKFDGSLISFAGMMAKSSSPSN